MWWHIIIVVVWMFSLAAILAQWKAYVVEFLFGGWAKPEPNHCNDFASLAEPNNRSRVHGES